MLLISFISSIVYPSSSLNKQLSLLSENLLKKNIVLIILYLSKFLINGFEIIT
ncbi:hypothetical protein GNN72_11735 [Salmonella enterica]|nr:hypothetical protein [Salmonella enterica]EEK4696046.1 hypothetical protein [Salmonella enterica]